MVGAGIAEHYYLNLYQFERPFVAVVAAVPETIAAAAVAITFARYLEIAVGNLDSAVD